MRSPPQRRPRRPPARAAAAAATAAPRPPLFPNGRYARSATMALAQLRRSQRLQITRLQVRMPLSCQNTRTHAHSAPDARVRRPDRHALDDTYSRIFLPADGATNVSFVVDDDGRQPEIYLSLQLRGGVGPRQRARAQPGRDARRATARSASTSASRRLTRSRELSRSPRASRRQPSASAITPATIAAAPASRCQPPRSA